MDGVDVVGFVGGGHCVRLVSFSVVFASVSLKEGKTVKLTFPPLNQRSHPPTTRMYAPSEARTTKPHHPREERTAQSELLPSEPLRPISSTQPIVPSSQL